jgi:hypothetical protein
MAFNKLNRPERTTIPKLGAVALQSKGGVCDWNFHNLLNLQEKMQNISILVNTCVIVAVL